MSGNIDPVMMKRLDLASAGIAGLEAFGNARQTRRQAKYLQRLRELQAHDAVSRGESEAARKLAQGIRAGSSNAATLAGRGFEVGVGTATALENAPSILAQIDAATLRTSARKDAQAFLDEAKGFGDRASALNLLTTTGGTLLGEYGKVARRWYQRSAVTEGTG